MSKKKATPSDPPEVIELFEIIANLFPDAGGFDGVAVRSVPTKYANKNDFYSGFGAVKTGGRWNRIGLETIYSSLDVMTATAEAYQKLLHFRFLNTMITPRVTAGAKVVLAKVLDLNDIAVLSEIGFTNTELIEEDWRALQKTGVESWTQAIGRGCNLAQFEALIVPSARHEGGKNIVIFPQNLGESSKIEILGADQLPR